MFGGYDYAQTDTMEMIYDASRGDSSQFLKETDMALSDKYLERYFSQVSETAWI